MNETSPAPWRVLAAILTAAAVGGCAPAPAPVEPVESPEPRPTGSSVTVSGAASFGVTGAWR